MKSIIKLLGDEGWREEDESVCSTPNMRGALKGKRESTEELCREEMRRVGVKGRRESERERK